MPNLHLIPMVHREDGNIVKINICFPLRPFSPCLGTLKTQQTRGKFCMFIDLFQRLIHLYPFAQASCKRFNHKMALHLTVPREREEIKHINACTFTVTFTPREILSSALLVTKTHVKSSGYAFIASTSVHATVRQAGDPRPHTLPHLLYTMPLYSFHLHKRKKPA